MIRLLKDLATVVMGVVEVLLVLRFLMRLLVPHLTNDLVVLLYTVTSKLLLPFLQFFPTPSVRGGIVLEFVTLFAIFAYAFMGYLIQEILDMVDKQSR